jgi:hypothetical protein
MLLTNDHDANGQLILLNGSIVNIWLLVAVIDLMMYFEVFKSYEVSQLWVFMCISKLEIIGVAWWNAINWNALKKFKWRLYSERWTKKFSFYMFENVKPLLMRYYGVVVKIWLIWKRFDWFVIERLLKRIFK